MTNYPEIVKAIAWRTLIALPFFALAFGLGGFAATFGPILIVVGAVIVASPLARLIAEPAGGLFYAVRRFSRPQPMYSIPQSQRAKGLYEEAIAGFEKIAKDYPGEIQPYIEMIDIAIVNLSDARRANLIYQNGLAALKKKRDQEILARMYSGIRTRLNAKPSN